LEKTITLQILGRTYTFQIESGARDAQKVATHFEDAVNKVQSQYNGKMVHVDKETILILAGLKMASEHYQLEDRYQRCFNRMTEKSAVVLNELEKAMA
jgi:cell division protein ZapA (FtsZ GTPase activity inhibitor)